MPRDEACVGTRTVAWWRRVPARWRRSPSLVRRHLHSFYGCFDERSHRIWLRHVDRVTARYLDDWRTCAFGHETLGRRWFHAVVGVDQVAIPFGVPPRIIETAPLRLPAPQVPGNLLNG